MNFRNTISPSPLRPEEVPEDLKCSICFGVPINPKLLPCEHAFCNECISKALSALPKCPNCRLTCNPNQIYDLRKDSMPYRIWSSIAVKCTKHEEGCSWTGSIADFQNHASRCMHGGMFHTHRLEIERLNKRIQNLEDENRDLKMKLRELPEVASMLMQEALRGHELLPKIFYGDYSFRRENVVELTQLISRNLENKPHDIESNRIYQCVSNCYRDLTQGYSDNPPHFTIDMQMLLSTCLASTWFTDRQLMNIRRWLREYDWDN